MHLRAGTKKALPPSGWEIKRARTCALFLLIIVLPIGGLYLRCAWLRHERVAASQAIVLAQSLEAMLHPEHIAELAGDRSDENNPNYAMAKQSLMRMVEATGEIHFAYLLAERDGRVVFLMDSEPAESPDYSWPGQVYEEASDSEYADLLAGRTVLTGPETDRWGTWISAMVPVTDPADGTTVAVFGTDYSASEWRAGLLQRMIPDSAVVVSLILLLYFLGRTRFEHLCLIEDVSKRRQMEEALKESERSKAVLLAHLPGLAFRCRNDREWTMQFVSEGCLALTGYAPDSLINNRDLSYNSIIAPEYRELLWNEWARILGQRSNFSYEYEIVTKTGERKWVLELAQGIFGDDAGNVEALEGIVIDITEQKAREAQVTYLSERDLLTGLYNRGSYEKEKARLDQQKFWPLSVAICDINGLRMINDAFGHAEGDRLITDMARLLRNCCRKEYVVSRTGGDEYRILMPCTDGEQANKLAKKIQYTVELYCRTENGRGYEVSLSIGYGTKESEEKSIEDAEKTAEAYLGHRKLLNQKSSHNAILSSIMATLYAKSQETEEHGKRLTRLTKMMGEHLGLDQELMDDLELLSMLHDIGKIGVDDRILNKPDKLTPEEWDQMKKHAEIGYRIVMSTPELEHIAHFILHHHERWDGTGYPAGLKGREIPLPSRILSVADAFDAMTEDRVYRTALPRETALAEVARNAGTQFDPEIAKLLAQLLK